MVGFHGTIERRSILLVEGIDCVAIDEQLSHQLVIAGRGCLVERCRAENVDGINMVGILIVLQSRTLIGSMHSRSNDVEFGGFTLLECTRRIAHYKTRLKIVSTSK